VLDDGGGVENGHGSIFPEGFGNDVSGGYFFSDVLAGFGEVFLVGDKENLRRRDDFLTAFDGLLEEGFGTKDGEKLFGIVSAGERPKTGAGTATENYDEVFWCVWHRRPIVFLKFSIKTF